jgi:heptosyltransferase-2
MRMLLLRPGALGDVIAARAAIGAVRAGAPDAEVLLLAPGGRGRLLERPGLADRVLDLDGAEAAWLFADTDEPPPPPLRGAAGDPAHAFAWLADPDGATGRALARLGAGAVHVLPPRPEERGKVHIHEHLARPVREALGLETSPLPALAVPLGAVHAAREAAGLTRRPYAVLHPGSGSPRKNWPDYQYETLARRLAGTLEIVVTSGEADGDLGARLARRAAARHLHDRPLEELAALLAGADLYVGNDSGVSHLAAAVESGGRRPHAVVLFGPTLPQVWGPPAAMALRVAHGALSELSVDLVETVCRAGLTTPSA